MNHRQFDRDNLKKIFGKAVDGNQIYQKIQEQCCGPEEMISKVLIRADKIPKDGFFDESHDPVSIAPLVVTIESKKEYLVAHGWEFLRRSEEILSQNMRFVNDYDSGATENIEMSFKTLLENSIDMLEIFKMISFFRKVWKISFTDPWDELEEKMVYTVTQLIEKTEKRDFSGVVDLLRYEYEPLSRKIIQTLVEWVKTSEGIHAPRATDAP